MRKLKISVVDLVIKAPIKYADLKLAKIRVRDGCHGSTCYGPGVRKGWEESDIIAAYVICWLTTARFIDTGREKPPRFQISMSNGSNVISDGSGSGCRKVRSITTLMPISNRKWSRSRLRKPQPKSVEDRVKNYYLSLLRFPCFAASMNISRSPDRLPKLTCR